MSFSVKPLPLDPKKIKGLSAGGQPILALDMYEHAYHMDYGAKAGDYVEAFMQAIRWSNADSLYENHVRG